MAKFPFLFGGTFIEGALIRINRGRDKNISLPFRRDFH